MSAREKTTRWLECEGDGCMLVFGPKADVSFYALRRQARAAGWQYYWTPGKAERKDLCPQHKVTP